MCVHALRESAQWNKEEMLLFSIALRIWSAALTGKLHQRRNAEVGLFFIDSICKYKQHIQIHTYKNKYINKYINKLHT